MATADVAIESLVEVVAVAKIDCSKLTPQYDSSSQYAGKKFQKVASLLDTHLGFTRTYTPGQNGHIKSFYSTLKREYIRPHDFSNYQEAETVISEAFRNCNRSKLHSALKYVPPDEFLAHGRQNTNEGLGSIKSCEKRSHFPGFTPPDMKFMRYSKYKNGTHLCNTLVSIYCVTEGFRVRLGVLLRTRNMFPSEAVVALLDMCEGNDIRVGTLLLDREFYSAQIMDLLNSRSITWLMSAVKNDAIKETVARFERGERGAVSVHSISSGKIFAEFTLIIHPAID